MTGTARLAAAVVLIGLLMATAIVLQRVRDRLYPARTFEGSVLYVTSPATARRLTLEYAALYPLLDLTTSLDPRFNLAYRFGSIFLAEPAPRGPGRPDLAIALLKK